MREILPNKLWLGNAADVRNVEGIMQSGIQAVIDLAIEQLLPTLPRSLVYCRFPILDGQQSSSTAIADAIETLVSVLATGGIPSLVCCSAGMSRSPAVVAGALSVFQGGTPDDRFGRLSSDTRTTFRRNCGKTSEAFVLTWRKGSVHEQRLQPELPGPFERSRHRANGARRRRPADAEIDRKHVPARVRPRGKRRGERGEERQKTVGHFSA